MSIQESLEKNVYYFDGTEVVRTSMGYVIEPPVSFTTYKSEKDLLKHELMKFKNIDNSMMMKAALHMCCSQRTIERYIEGESSKKMFSLKLLKFLNK